MAFEMVSVGSKYLYYINKVQVKKLLLRHGDLTLCLNLSKWKALSTLHMEFTLSTFSVA